MDHSERDRAHHEAIAWEYERVVNEPRALGNQALFSNVPNMLKSRRSMLDLGCGTGQMIDRFGALFDSATGVDHSPAMLQVARAKPAGKKAQYLQNDVMHYIHNCEEQFDLISMVGFLHHLKAADAVQVIKDARRCLSANGLLLIAEPMDFDALDEPKTLTWWNQVFRSQFQGYKTHAEDPDEAPIPEVTIRSWLSDSGLKVLHARRGWEIFPRFNADWRDRLLIPILDRFCRRRGVVGLFVASKA
jgi:SAM-dependent methyltransferase